MNTNPRRRDQPVDHDDLAELLPAPGRPVLAQDRHRVLRDNLMEHITRESTPEQSGATNTSPSVSPDLPVRRDPVRKGPARRRPGRRLVLVAAPLALAAVVGLGVVAVDSAQDGRRGTPAADATGDDHRKAAQLLDRIALAAADRPAVTVRDDQYVYTRLQGSSDELGWPATPPKDTKGLFTPAPVAYEGTVRREQWDSVDGERDGLRKSVGLSSTGEPDSSHQDVMTMSGAGYLAFRRLQALPTDPDALLKKLSGDARNVEESRLTEVIVENLGTVIDDATLLPDLSAAIYRAMARLPGVRVVDHVKDAAGREGVGLTFEGAPKGYAWVFDSSSLVHLGTTDAALMEVGVADKAGEVPAGSS
ncbi:CU044_5270 family protein [Streptomyces phaeochromogenes]|uniref:CU044_5270 family protein n=1 Tax=Streptomyces phaeochromogenes TaxID=1923 RepID=UPI002DDB82C9|nr:CU044_5270 family protein [Streptomyces phaeochromogenes]WRZ34081.1 CU044_5270 family protein [Streptomyces phaeochromogenes]